MKATTVAGGLGDGHRWPTVRVGEASMFATMTKAPTLTNQLADQLVEFFV